MNIELDSRNVVKWRLFAAGFKLTAMNVLAHLLQITELNTCSKAQGMIFNRHQNMEAKVLSGNAKYPKLLQNGFRDDWSARDQTP